MNFNITQGPIQKAQKVILYGVEGIGKSTFLSHFPDPLFIDTEGSTAKLNVKRLDRPSSWIMLLDMIDYVANTPGVCKTLCIDTADWAERLCAEHICDKAGKKGIEDFGYGNGFTYLSEEFGRLLNRLQGVIDRGINVAISAHAQVVKFEQPDEQGAYDRWEMKLGIKKTEKRTAAMLKEWADMVLFANYKTVVFATDDKGTKHKATGGQRVMYTAHHPCWDAKNRHDLPAELPLDFAAIAHCIPGATAAPQTVLIAPQTVPIAPQTPQNDLGFEVIKDDTPEPEPTQTPAPAPVSAVPSGVPQALADLMAANNVTEEEIRTAVASRGYFPFDTPIANYGADFINGCLIGAWPQVFGIIQEARKDPF